MDLRMPDVDGVTATERILALLPATRIVVVTTYESDTDILRAVEAGAAGYLLKDASRTELADAIRDAARGKTVLAPSVADRLVRFVRQPLRRHCRRARSRCSAWWPSADQRRHRPRPAHQRGDREDPSAAGVQQVGRVRPHGGGDDRDVAGPVRLSGHGRGGNAASHPSPSTSINCPSGSLIIADDSDTVPSRRNLPIRRPWLNEPREIRNRKERWVSPTSSMTRSGPAGPCVPSSREVPAPIRRVRGTWRAA